MHLFGKKHKYFLILKSSCDVDRIGVAGMQLTVSHRLDIKINEIRKVWPIAMQELSISHHRFFSHHLL